MSLEKKSISNQQLTDLIYLLDSHEANFGLFHAIYLLGIEKQHLPRRDLLSNKLGRRHAEIQRHHGDLNPVQSDLHQAEHSSLQDNLFK